MSDPITAAMVGAGVGGGTSLLRGKSLGSALQNAAIGGVLGGAGGALGGAMGGAGGTTGATGATGNVMGEIGGANLITGATGAGGTLSSGLGVAPTFADRAGQFLYTLPSNTMDAIKANPIGTAGLGLGIYDRMNAQQQMQAPQLGLIRPQQTGQYQPTLQARIPQLPRRPILIG